uniref:ARAD1D11352p n=1 Tax=Blastobotrys adeninivorans TaxID=409370 RepID=A0A060TEX2_BLAAD
MDDSRGEPSLGYGPRRLSDPFLYMGQDDMMEYIHFDSKDPNGMMEGGGGHSMSVDSEPQPMGDSSNTSEDVLMNGLYSPQGSNPSSSISSNVVSPQMAPQMASKAPDYSSNQLFPSSSAKTEEYLDASGSNGLYRAAQAQLSAMKFGRDYSTGPIPVDPPRDYEQLMQEYSQILQQGGVDQSQYKYRLYVGDMPYKSRVETQIKCRLVLSPVPSEFLLHLPSDTIARPKFQLHDKFKPTPNSLDLDVDVISDANHHKPIFICSRCMNREKKRAFRKKNLDSNEEYHWNEDRPRRLAIFNSKEVVAFSLAKACDVGEDNIIQGKEIEVPMRLACYCRHHGAKSGFRVIFTIRDHQGNVVAREITKPILITDDHKDPKDPSKLTARSSTGGTVTPWGNSTTGPPSPASGEAESSEAFSDQSSHSLKRRRDSSWNGSTRQQMWPASAGSSTSLAAKFKNDVDIPSPQSDGASQLTHMQSLDANFATNGIPTPQIQRIIPSQGSVRGGIEVTLLGSGFHSNLSAIFGDTKSMNTQCWSDSTIVAHLPPAAGPGPVVVSFDGYTMSNPQIFTYFDDTDRQLIELALQVVGMKMNGKLEDARNIARRIVGSGSGNDGGNGDAGNGGGANIGNTDTYGGTSNHENVTLRCIELICISSGGKVPNWQLRNSEGQTMMHLAAALGYSKVCVALVSQGARVDAQDANGMTPLHFASLHGRRKIVDLLLRCHADPYQQTLSGLTSMDVAAPSVTELLPVGVERRDYREHSRSSSSSTLASVDEFNTYVSRHRDLSDDEEAIPRIGSHASSMNYLVSPFTSEDEDDFDFDSEDELDDLSIEVSRTTRSRRPSEGATRVRHVDDLTDYDPQAASSSSSSSEQPAKRETKKTTAHNISAYLSRLSTNARNRIHWEGPNSWEEALNYIYRRRRIRKDDGVTSDSDGTVVGGSSRNSTSVVHNGANNGANIARMWQYFKPNSPPQSPVLPPPSYDEIFPDKKDSVEKSPEQQYEPVDRTNTQSPKYGLRLVQEWAANNNRIQISNDRMLLFFWLPALVLSIVFYFFKRAGLLGNVGIYMDEFGAQIREKLSTMVVGKKVEGPKPLACMGPIPQHE